MAIEAQAATRFPSSVRSDMWPETMARFRHAAPDGAWSAARNVAINMTLLTELSHGGLCAGALTRGLSGLRILRSEELPVAQRRNGDVVLRADLRDGIGYGGPLARGNVSGLA